LLLLVHVANVYRRENGEQTTNAEKEAGRSPLFSMPVLHSPGSRYQKSLLSPRDQRATDFGQTADFARALLIALLTSAADGQQHAGLNTARLLAVCHSKFQNQQAAVDAALLPSGLQGPRAVAPADGAGAFSLLATRSAFASSAFTSAWRRWWARPGCHTVQLSPHRVSAHANHAGKVA
jgi:hypothetical protein